MRFSFHWPPGCAALLVGGEALVSPRRFIPQPIIMSNKWVSAGSDMLANTNYAQRERLQLGHILKNLYRCCVFLWRSAPFALPMGPVEDHHLALQSAMIRRGSKSVFVCALLTWVCGIWPQYLAAFWLGWSHTFHLVTGRSDLKVSQLSAFPNGSERHRSAAVNKNRATDVTPKASP